MLCCDILIQRNRHFDVSAVFFQNVVHKDDKGLIKSLYEIKGSSARQLVKEFPSKDWNVCSVCNAQCECCWKAKRHRHYRQTSRKPQTTQSLHSRKSWARWRPCFKSRRPDFYLFIYYHKLNWESTFLWTSVIAKLLVMCVVVPISLRKVN